MKRLTIYTSGAEKNAPKGFTSWRNILKSFIDELYDDKIKLLDPMMHFNYSDKAPKTPRQCYNYFMWLIDQCDVILVNLDHSKASVGTFGEVQHGADNHKPIIGFGSNPDTWYEWTAELCDVIFDSMGEAVSYIVEHYCDI